MGSYGALVGSDSSGVWPSAATGWQDLCAIAEPLEPVENQVEPELVGVDPVLAGLRLDVLEGVLCEVRVVLREVPAHEASQHVVELRGIDRPVVQDERGIALDVALDDVVRVIGQLLRETRVAEAAEERVAVLQPAG